MKRFLLLLAALSISGKAAAGCLKVEYQELKEFTEKELVTKYCNDKAGFSSKKDVAEFERAISQASKAIGDSDGESKALDEWVKASEDAEVCRSEMDRTKKILDQRNFDEGELVTRCVLNR